MILRENVIVTQTLTNLSHRATVFAHNIDRSSSVDAFIVVLVVIIFVVGPAYTTVHRFQKVRPFDLAQIPGNLVNFFSRSYINEWGSDEVLVFETLLAEIDSEIHVKRNNLNMNFCLLLAMSYDDCDKKSGFGLYRKS